MGFYRVYRRVSAEFYPGISGLALHQCNRIAAVHRFSDCVYPPTLFATLFATLLVMRRPSAICFIVHRSHRHQRRSFQPAALLESGNRQGCAGVRVDGHHDGGRLGVGRGARGDEYGWDDGTEGHGESWRDGLPSRRWRGEWTWMGCLAPDAGHAATIRVPECGARQGRERRRRIRPVAAAAGPAGVASRRLLPGGGASRAGLPAAIPQPGGT